MRREIRSSARQCRTELERQLTDQRLFSSGVWHASDPKKINAHRLGFWGAHSGQEEGQLFSCFSEWNPLGEGAYGKVFLIPLFPPISIRGERVAEAVVKAAKEAKGKDNQVF